MRNDGREDEERASQAALGRADDQQELQMSGFLRRWDADPGDDILLEIESVNVIDLAPPPSITGIGTGAVIVVGEFEDGPYASPTEVFGTTDFIQQFGTFGFPLNGLPAAYPCAVARAADSAVSPEFWNGNAMVQLSGKTFARLIVCRADTSVGAVQFTRVAYLTGAALPRYTLASGQVLALDFGSGPTSATFTAAVASVTGSGGAFAEVNPGDTVTLGYDNAPNFTTTFLTGDTTNTLQAARINTAVGFAFASVSGGQIQLTGRQVGNGGQVQVVSATSAVSTTVVVTYASGTTIDIASTTGFAAGGHIIVTDGTNTDHAVIASVGSGPPSLTLVSGLAHGYAVGATVKSHVLANLGLSVADSQITAAITAGSGNVADVSSVTDAEVAAVVQAAVAQSKVEVDQNGALRISNLSGTPTILVGSATTALALGFAPGAFASATSTPGTIVSGAGTYPVDVHSGTLTLGYDNAPNFTVTFTSGDTALSLATVVARINAMAPYAMASPIGSTKLQLAGLALGGQVRVVAVTGAASALGLTVGSAVGYLATAAPLPAGTVVTTANGATVFVTTQSTPISATSAGPYSVRVRPAVDDGSLVATTAASAVTTIPNPPPSFALSVTNVAMIGSAFTEAAIDAAYGAALDATRDINTVAKQGNIIFSARQSNAMRRGLVNNAQLASAKGCYGRIAVGRPPLGTLSATAQSTTAEPGVGMYRSRRFIYCYPAANTNMPLIASTGLAGGEGFTADGNVDVGADGFLASVMSQLAPEQNPGQETSFLTYVNGLESSPNAQGFDMDDYISFKAAGICALRIDDGVAAFESGVTSVDPLAYPTLTSINRQRFADFLGDSLAIAAKPYLKQLQTQSRRDAFDSANKTFLRSLVKGQRMQGFSYDNKSGNSADSLARGLYRVKIGAQTIPDFLSIVLEMTVGTTVVVTDTSTAQAA
jgi:hypothetical protein